MIVRCAKEGLDPVSGLKLLDEERLSLYIELNVAFRLTAIDAAVVPQAEGKVSSCVVPTALAAAIHGETFHTTAVFHLLLGKEQQLHSDLLCIGSEAWSQVGNLNLRGLRCQEGS